MNNKNNYGIFSDVQFMNESEVGGAIALLALCIGLINIDKVLLLASKIPNKDQRLVNRSISLFAKSHSDVEKFNANIHTIKKIGIDQLQTKVKLSDKDADRCKYNSVMAIAIFDKKENIMAYAIFDDATDGYAYTIYTNSFGKSKELNIFVQAKFENHMKLYGPGLASILKDKPLNSYKKYIYTGGDSSAISEDEFNDILNQMTTIFTPIKQSLEAIYKKHSKDFDLGIYQDRDGILRKYNSGEEVTPDFDICFSYDYNEIGDVVFDVIADCGEACIKAMKKFGFEPDSTEWSDFRSVKNNKYPYIEIYFYEYGSENKFGVLVSTRKKFHKK